MIRRAACGLWWLAALALLVSCGGCGGGGEVTRIVVVTFDTTRADRLGCYGYAEAETPHLDRLAGEGVLFEQAISAVPTTLPSHSTIFTGLYPQDHGVRYNIMFRLGAESVTLAEVLAQNGYATAAFPASFILARRYGLEQGFQTWVEPPQKTGEMAVARSEAVLRPANEGVDQALNWLEHRPAGSKSFVWLHFYDPHHPYEPPFPYSARFRDNPYDGELAYTDNEFGRLLERLRRDPDWSRTLLVVTSDHGEGLYDHGEKMHQNLVYDATQHVPLIIRAPGVAARRVDEPVSLADIMPTVLDLAGIPRDEALRGVSLAPVLRGAAAPRRDIYFESLSASMSYGWAELRGIRYGKWKLIDSAQAPELFDIEADPGELENLAGLEPGRVEEIRASLTRLREPVTREPQAESTVDAVDAETQALLASLGYVSGGSGGSATQAPEPRELIHLENELLRGQLLVGRKQWEQVLRFTDEMLPLDPSNKWALAHRAAALMQLQRPREAQDYAALLVEYYPESDHSYASLARTYNAQEKHDEAFRVLETGLKLVPDSEMLSYLFLAAAFDARRQGVCENDVPALLARFSESNGMIVMQARCEALAGNEDTALATLERAVHNGFRQLEIVEHATDFSSVVALPGYAALVETAQRERPSPS